MIPPIPAAASSAVGAAVSATGGGLSPLHWVLVIAFGIGIGALTTLILYIASED